MRGDLSRRAELLMLMPEPMKVVKYKVAVDTDLRLIRGSHISKHQLTT
jgi:hypothetical protein